jgi:hypothetical protein
MKTYRVRWDILIEAESARAAIRQAKEILADRENEATIFSATVVRPRGAASSARRRTGARHARTSTRRR